MSYPILMVKGDALTPQRFWDYREVANDKEKKDLEDQGFVQSNKQLQRS